MNPTFRVSFVRRRGPVTAAPRVLVVRARNMGEAMEIGRRISDERWQFAGAELLPSYNVDVMDLHASRARGNQ